MKKLLPVLVVVSIVLGITSGYWFGKSNVKSTVPQIEGTVLHPARLIKDFTLQDHELNEFSVADLLGKWHLMFFGYTHCPDVCPTTLNTLKSAYENLSDSERRKLSVVFVSIDPYRDLPETLGEYVRYFNKDFIGVTANDAALKDFTRQLSVVYMKSNPGKSNPGKSIPGKSAPEKSPSEKSGAAKATLGIESSKSESESEDYLMDHSATIVLINPRAEVQAYLRAPHTPKSILNSVRKTRDFFNN